jgi:hypothetical protein
MRWWLHKRKKMYRYKAMLLRPCKPDPEGYCKTESLAVVIETDMENFKSFKDDVYGKWIVGAVAKI